MAGHHRVQVQGGWPRPCCRQLIMDPWWLLRVLVPGGCECGRINLQHWQLDVMWTAPGWDWVAAALLRLRLLLRNVMVVMGGPRPAQRITDQVRRRRYGHAPWRSLSPRPRPAGPRPHWRQSWRRVRQQQGLAAPVLAFDMCAGFWVWGRARRHRNTTWRHRPTS